MSRGQYIRRWRWIVAPALAALMLARPRAASLGAARAMAHWYATVAPAVFPFMALMPLLTCRDAARAYECLLGRVTWALYDLPGAAASAMVVGMMAGSPAGAIAARRVAAQCGMNRGQLRRLAFAFSGFSPAFLVGGVGAAMLGSAAMGWRLLAAQVLAQLTLALLLRRMWRNQTAPVPAAPDVDDQPIRAAVLAVLGICGYMALFGAITGAAGDCLGRGPADALLCLLDVPSGARLVAALPTDAARRLVLLSGMCGFGGACVAAQNLAALRGCGVRAWEYVAARVSAAALCAGYAALISRLDVIGETALTGCLRANPFAAAALAAALLAIPALICAAKPCFNK